MGNSTSSVQNNEIHNETLNKLKDILGGNSTTEMNVSTNDTQKYIDNIQNLLNTTSEAANIQQYNAVTGNTDNLTSSEPVTVTHAVFESTSDNNIHGGKVFETTSENVFTQTEYLVPAPLNDLVLNQSGGDLIQNKIQQLLFETEATEVGNVSNLIEQTGGDLIEKQIEQLLNMPETTETNIYTGGDVINNIDETIDNKTINNLRELLENTETPNFTEIKGGDTVQEVAQEINQNMKGGDIINNIENLLQETETINFSSVNLRGGSLENQDLFTSEQSGGKKRRSKKSKREKKKKLVNHITNIVSDEEEELESSDDDSDSENDKKPRNLEEVQKIAEKMKAVEESEQDGGEQLDSELVEILKSLKETNLNKTGGGKKNKKSSKKSSRKSSKRSSRSNSTGTYYIDDSDDSDGTEEYLTSTSSLNTSDINIKHYRN